MVSSFGRLNGPLTRELSFQHQLQASQCERQQEDIELTDTNAPQYLAVSYPKEKQFASDEPDAGTLGGFCVCIQLDLPEVWERERPQNLQHIERHDLRPVVVMAHYLDDVAPS